MPTRTMAEEPIVARSARVPAARTVSCILYIDPEFG